MTRGRYLSRTTLLAMLLVALAHPLRAGDSLSSLREDVRTPQPSKESSPPPAKEKKAKENSWFSSSDDCDSCQNDSSDDGTLLLAGCALAGVVATSPFWAPIGLCEDDSSVTGYFAPYPYENSTGSMLFDRDAIGEVPPDAFAWATKLRGEYGDDFDSLTRFSGHILAEHSNRWGFDSETNYWREGRGNGQYDELWTGDANLLYRFAQTERAQFRTGIGANWLNDSAGTELGFNFTYGADFYPMKPLVLSSELDAGWLGEAWLIHLRTTVGVQWRQVEFYTGYDYREIGSTQLDGWIAGVRVLF